NAEILARAGVGTISIVDRDVVEWSNLQRQSLYDEQDVLEQLPKAIAAQKRLEKLNSSIQIHAYVMDCHAQELARLADGVDLIIDATDNFEIRFLINDISYKQRIPWIFGA